MDELRQLELLEELEDLEEDDVNIEEIQVQVREPMIELNNFQFKKIFRVNKELFQFIVTICEPFLRPARRPTDLGIPLKILTALRFFATGSYQLDIGSNWFLGVSQSSVSRIVTEVASTLNREEIFNEWVKFPNTIASLNECRRRFFEEYQFPGIIGCIDCTHVAIFPPNIEDAQYPEHVYVNRKAYHSINVQLICDADLKILNVNARFPGSTHDSYIWNNSNAQQALRNLHITGNTDYFLLGDSGYQQRTYLMTPISPDPPNGTPEHHYNRRHKQTRSLIERCNGVLKTRFRCLLKHRVLHYKPARACKIINACVVLHNLCITYNVGDPDPEDDDDENDFGIYDNNSDADDEDDAQDEAVRRRNPELAEGRRAREKLIRQMYRMHE